MPCDPLSHDEWVTQYGRVSSGFKCHPLSRDRGERELSVLRGVVSVEVAARYVLQEDATDDDVVRYAQVSALIERTFEICHTPTNRNPLHTSVVSRGEWNDDFCEGFRLAFDDSSGTGMGHDEPEA